MNISVRELALKDIDVLADYWLTSSNEHLVGMGVDLSKLPTRIQLTEMLKGQLEKTLEEKQSYALIWLDEGKQIGHTNVNQIELGKQATMHLHLWNATNRKKGMGTELVKMSLPFYFEKLQIETLWCEPYALNPAPNKTLEKIGFEFVKRYTIIPGSLNFEQEVNQWKLTKEKFESLYKK